MNDAYDLVIRGATVVDGTGSLSFPQDVAVHGDRVAAVGIELGAARHEIVATGSVLCPGFVDCHAHDDFLALVEPELGCKLLQGITSEVVGNCGIGAAPRRSAEVWIQRFGLASRLPAYDTFQDYFETLEQVSPALNLLVLAGHGTLRSEARGLPGRLGDREFVKMEALLDEALAAGVAGLSTGLVYSPGRDADRGEIVRLLRRLPRSSALYATHLRNEADELVNCVDEAIQIAEEARVSLQLSHHKAYGPRNFGKVQATLALVDAARARGVDVWLDQYPYTTTSTVLQSLVERGTFEVDRASGPSSTGGVGPDEVVISSAPGAEEMVGLTVRELGDRLGLTPARAASFLLARAPDTWVLVHALSEDDVVRVLRHPRTLVGTDGTAVLGAKSHPRLRSSFPRILTRYVGSGVLTLEGALAKMTSAAARRFGLVDRGEIRPGAFADLVLFDPARLTEGATFDAPDRSPDGFDGVWVNGVRVVEAGKLTGRRAGRVLRRGHSRP